MRITVTVKANSSTATLTMVKSNDYIARVDVEAQKGKANLRLIEMLGEHFGVPKSSIRIVRGLKSKSKVVEICGAVPES